jgi:tetratricopeptide (TPR) repeat protein
MWWTRARAPLALLALLVSVSAQSLPPAVQAYAALRARDFDNALRHFEAALRDPSAPLHIRKDYAYTLLKVGRREEARDQFERLWTADAADGNSGLEFAFLCYETHRERDARRAFLVLRSSPDPPISHTAQTAFENIDRPLREGIARWTDAVRSAPGQWSAHEELARLAEHRDQLDLAAEHYRAALHLRPERRELLLHLARVEEERGNTSESKGLLLQAAGSPEPRIAETARAQLPPDAASAAAAVVPPPALQTVSAKTMGLRSLEKSYLPDALRYFRIAQEDDPADPEVALKLAQTLNLLGRDGEALEWFDRARKLGAGETRREATRSFRALRAAQGRITFSAWMLPVSSSRWNDLFLYGQARAAFRISHWRLKPYLSLRFSGDVRGNAGAPALPVYLSESAVIAAGGLGLPVGKRLHLWAEAGEAFSYVGQRPGYGFAHPDYRGGASWSRFWGRAPGTARGRFHETTADIVYLSRFAHNVIGYLQNRTGYTFPPGEGGWQAQAFLNWNLTADRLREPWANFVEAGPGFRFRWGALPQGLWLRTDFLRGAYLLNHGNLYRPNYWDFRAGLWYALSR